MPNPTQNNHLYKEIQPFCSDETIYNIYKNHTKVVGIKYNPSIINENNRYVGEILLINNVPDKDRLFLGSIVQFHTEKLQWRSIKIDGDFEFCLINSHYVKSYAPDPKINVPVVIREDDKFIIENVKLTLNQYKQRRMNEYYYKNKTPYIHVAAYRNFYKMLPTCQGFEYRAFNSTSKHYYISQDELKSILSEFNNERKRINRDWNKWMNEHIIQNETTKLINKLYGREEKEKELDNVLKMRDFS